MDHGCGQVVTGQDVKSSQGLVTYLEDVETTSESNIGVRTDSWYGDIDFIKDVENILSPPTLSLVSWPLQSYILKP